MPASTRRILLIILGVFVVAGSVAGFYFMSDAFDKRTPVLVAAVDIQKGDTVGAGHFASDSAVMGSIPHIPYTPDAQFAFDGFTASQPIPAGTVILGDMFIPPTLPGPGELELTVEFDTSLLTSPAYNGDTVLIVVPGVEPTAESPGRPHEAIDTLVLSNYQDGAMTMFFKPEELDEWSAWKLLPEAIDAAPQIMAVPLGTEPEEFAQLINGVWQSEWEPRAAAVAAAQVPPTPPRPDGLELTVQFDTGLLTSPVYDGDTVLIVIPGIEPTAEDLGRPHEAIDTLVLSNYEDGSMTMYFKPEELGDWSAWRLLPEAIGAAPQIMLVPSGSNPEEFTQLINGVWQSEWEPKAAAVAAAQVPPTPPRPDGLELTVRFDTGLLTSPAYNGNTVLIVAPGIEPTTENPGRPQIAVTHLELSNYEVGSMTMYFKPEKEELEEWSAWRLLPETIGAAPQIMLVPSGSNPEEFTQLVNGLWQSEWETRARIVSAASDGASLISTGLRLGFNNLEVTVPLNTSLAATEPSEGDTVLIVDPGQPPDGDDVGRPRRVLQTVELENFDGAAMRLLVPPDEWLEWFEWVRLPEELGASPMVLPIPEETSDDTDAMIADLNGEWHDQWLAAIGEPSASDGQE